MPSSSSSSPNTWLQNRFSDYGHSPHSHSHSRPASTSRRVGPLHQFQLRDYTVAVKLIEWATHRNRTSELSQGTMRLFLFVGATIGLIGFTSGQGISEGNQHPCRSGKWQEDGWDAQPGKVWVENPNYDGRPCPTQTTTTYSPNSEDSQFPGEDVPRQNPKFEAQIPDHHGMNTDTQSSGKHH